MSCFRITYEWTYVTKFQREIDTRKKTRAEFLHKDRYFKIFSMVGKGSVSLNIFGGKCQVAVRM